MSKKLHSKLLSIILCIAICCATLCGSIIAVNAAAADYKGTYTISVGDDKQAVPFAATEVKAQVKFDLPAGFVGGQFTAKAQSNYTIGDEVSAVAATKKDGTALTADELATVEFVTRANGSDKDIRFVIGDGVLCTSVTIEYTILLNDYVNNGNTTQYAVAIDVDGANFGVEGDYADVTFTATADSDTWFHSHSAWCGLSNAVIDSTANGKHSVAVSICHLCKTVSNLDESEYTYLHIIPDHSEFEGVTTPTIAEGATEKSPTAWIGISGVTVKYADDGTLEVDVHAYSHWRSGATDKVELLVCDQNGNELQRLSCVPNGSSYFAGNGFPANEKMFTINGLSARDIDTQLYLVAVEYSTGTIEHSRTMPFCLADYCQNVVEGNSAIWVDGATSEQIEADKDVAAALYYYGAAIDENVFDKNTVGGGSSSSGIEYVNKSIVYWQDTTNYNNTPFASWDAFIASGVTGDGSEATPYIISTAEQLHYISTTAAEADTKGLYFKVADNVAVFDFTSNQVSDIEDISTYKFSKEGGVFAGIFDGNGAVVRNLYKKGNFPALFTKLGASATIKNITVTSSSFVASGGQYAKGAGAIFGGVTGSWGSDNIYVENCKVINCRMAAMDQSALSATFGAGIIGGYSHAFYVNINNCFVSGNTVIAPTNGSCGGLVATAYRSGKISNSIVLGTTPFSSWSAGISLEGCNYQNINTSTYTNVYTDQAITNCYTDQANTTLRTFTDAELKVISSSDASGAGAVNTLKLDNSIWFDTAEYPDISIFHKIAKTPVDENTHKEICVIRAGSATCSFKGLTENHTFVKNAEGTLLVCECGFSKEIIGNAVTPKNKTKVTWSGSMPKTFDAAAFTKGGGTVSDPYIITDPSQLWYIAQVANADTVGQYYKVDDSIAIFDFANINWGLSDNSARFQGNFDGNGVEFINFNSSGYNAGLFPNVTGTVTIKNVKLIGATLGESAGNVGGIIANINGDATTNVTISQCAVIDTTITAKTSAGAIVATGGNGPSLTITDCIVYNTTVTTSSTTTWDINDCVLGLSWSSGNCSISDSIILGCNPENRFGNISNVYTDYASVTNGNITKITDLNTIKGSGVVENLGLDSDVWFDTTGYPDFVLFHDMINVYVDENTHKSVCQIFVNGTQCTTCGPTEEHTLLTNDEGTLMICQCGYQKEIVGNSIKQNDKTVVYWGTGYIANRPATHDEAGFTKGSGASDDPYIVETVAQLWYVAQKSGSASAGVYYKVADGIAAFDISPDGSGWGLGDNSLRFQGHFDGNGVEIRGLNFGANGAYNAGLFPNVTGTVSISNIKIVDGEIKASTAVAGAIVANVNGTANVTISNCAVINSTVSSLGTGDSPVGAFVGHGGNGAYLTVNNCFVSNTTVTTNATSASYPSNAVLGVSWTPANCTISNSIILGCNPENRFSNFSNVYTDYASVTNSNITKVTDLNTLKGSGVVKNLDLDSDIWFDTDSYPELHVFHDMKTIYIDGNTHQYVCQVYVDGVQCTTCQSATTHNMVEAEDGKSASCECGYSYEIKGIHAMNLPESILNRITSNTVYTQKFATNALFKDAYNEDVYGTQVQENVFDMYATSLNLKVNPHIAFTFAFHGNYKTNKANITATFSVEGQVIATVTGAEMINNAGAGRYHLYRFKQLPVSKLCKDITVTVNYGGSDYDFGTYSAAGYAINAMNAGEDYQEHVNASMALVYYSEMLAARQG